MSFTAEAWAAVASIRAEIDALPFVKELGAGTLSRSRFVYYLAQDALYLGEYARALAATAVKAPRAEELAFFASSAHTAVVVERELHAKYVADLDGGGSRRASPTCAAYTSHLLSVAQTKGYAELVGAVLPCFWIYADVGARLLGIAGDLGEHPYGDWIATYSDEAFAASTETIRGIADRAAAESDPETVARMRAAFVTSSRYEWMFWDAAYRQEDWPV
ncbi:TenA family protein [Flindersiella endophytica]